MLLDKRLPLKFLLRQIRIEVLLISIYAIGITFLDEFFQLKGLISIPLAIPSLLGTTIALILGFRISQSYERWWEARKIWGSIVNDSRTLVRQVLTHVKQKSPKEEVYAVASKTANLQITWCYALGQALRKIDPLANNKKYLTAEEIKYLNTQSNIPNGILTLHAERLRKSEEMGWVNGFQVIMIDDTLSRLTTSMGMCERIKNTVFPRTYAIIVEFLLYLFVILLPFGLMDFLGYSEAPIIILISLPFFLLEKTAIYLQDPFENLPTDTPVTSISQGIEITLKQMVQDEVPVITVDTHDSFYVM
jgi:putative membrane protein